MNDHQDLIAHHDHRPPPLFIRIGVFLSCGHRVVKREDRGLEAEAVRSKVRLVLCLIPSPTQAQSPFTIRR